MDLFTSVVMVGVGGVFLHLALAKSTQLRGAFSRRPGVPVSHAGRVILAVIGLLVATKGIRKTLGKPPIELHVGQWLGLK